MFLDRVVGKHFYWIRLGALTGRGVGTVYLRIIERGFMDSSEESQRAHYGLEIGMQT